MDSPRNGCSEFDERLIEHAFSPSPDAELDRHLVACARCRAARERYLATADALGAALAVAPEPRRAAPARSRPRRLVLLVACAAAAVVLAIVLLRSRGEPGYSVRAIEGSVAFAEEPGRLRIDQGTAVFTVDGAPLVVDTPLGVARCTSGEFTLSVAREGGAASMNRNHAALVVTITVSAGAVWWTAGGHEVRVDSGAPWIEREASESALPAPDLASLEASSGALPPDRRAPLLAETDPAASEPADEAPPPGPEPRFEILGRVVDAETGAAIHGAYVTLGARRGDRKSFEAIAQSGADGRFRAISVALTHALPIRPGIYTDPFFVGTFLVAQAEGYSPRFEVPWERRDAGSALDAKRPIDLGEIRLYRGATIAGRVVDDQGAPVADAVLLLSEDLPGAASFSPASSEEVGRSAADGTFSLARRVPPARPPARIHLFAVASRGIGWTHLDVLEAKREMPAVEVRIGVAARLEVLVQDREGRPIAGADVRLEPRFDPLITPRYGFRHDHAMFYGARPDLREVFIGETDARGRARFERVPAPPSGGSYDVVVNAKGYARDWKDDVLVLAGRDTSAAVVLDAYRARAVSGTVRSEEGVPVAGAKVETHSEGRYLAATTDAAGAYRIEGVDPSLEQGWFVLTATGFVKIQRSVPFPGRGDVEGFDFVLQRPRAIAGRIVDEAGRPIAGAKPSLTREGDWRMFAGEQGRTGDDGTFRFEDATAGAWTLHVQSPEPAAEWLSAFSMQEVQGGDESVEVVFPRAVHAGARVVAEIVDAASGEPLDPVAAQMWPQGSWPAESRRMLPPVVRGAGRVVSEPVDPGTWRLWVRVAERATAFADIEIEPGQREARARIEVGAMAALQGRVLFDERIPYRAVAIEAQVGSAGVPPSGPDWSGASASVTQATLEVAEDGTFHLERATPGTWLLTLRANGLLGHGTVEVPSGGVGRGELRPIPGGLLVFRANDAAPKGGMRVELRVAEGDSGNDTYFRSVEVAEGAVFEHAATVWSGPVSWKVAFHGIEEPTWKPSEGLALPQSGSQQVAPGDVARIPVPIVLRN